MPRPTKVNKIKTERLDILLPEDVKHMLVQLAEDHNRSQTAEIIYLIKQEYTRHYQKGSQG